MLLTKRQQGEGRFREKHSSRPAETISKTSNLSLAPIGSETIIQDEDGNKIINNDMLKHYFKVVPKDSRFSRLRKVITHDLSQIWVPGEKQTPKYPIFGTPPKVNEQLYIVKDPCNSIFHYQEAIFPVSRAECQFGRLPNEVRQTLPITENNKRALKEVTEKRYSKPHYNIQYVNKNPIPEKLCEIYTRDTPKRTYEDRNQRITERCLISDRQLDEDVQGLHPNYPGLCHKIDNRTGQLVDQGYHYASSDYSRIKVPYDVRHYHFTKHPNAEPSNENDKEEVRPRNLLVAYTEMQAKHARHDFDDPPEMIGETELMRRKRDQKFPKKEYAKADLHNFDDKYRRPHLQRFVPMRVRDDPISVRGVTSISEFDSKEEEPWYTPAATEADYYHALYPKSMRRGSEYLANRIRRTSLIENAEREEALQNLKKKQQSFQTPENPPDYVSSVPTPDPIRVQAKTERHKESTKQDMRAHRRNVYANARINRPNREFSVNMKM